MRKRSPILRQIFRAEKETITDCAEELEIFHHLCELGQYALADQVMATCFHFLYYRGYYRDLLPIYQQLTHDWTVKNPSDAEEQRNLGWAWTRLGTLYQYLGQHWAAITAHEQAQTRFSNIDFPEGKSACLDHLGNAYHSLGQYQQAIDFHQQALKIDREIGDRNGEGRSLCNLGSSYRLLGQLQYAIECYREALVIQREVGNREFESKSLTGLGIAYHLLGQYQQAINFHQQALEITREIGNLYGEAYSLLTKAKACARYEPRRFEALATLQQARTIFLELQLDHRVEQCDEAIYDFNRIIATGKPSVNPQLAPYP